MVLGILNLEGRQNCKICLKKYNNFTIFLVIQKFKHKDMGLLSRGNRMEYCAAHGIARFEY